MIQAIALSAKPDWGHALLTPDGREIRVPAAAFSLLRNLGVLANNKARLSPMIYDFLDPQYDCLALGLRQLLGPDLSGPAWLVCGCMECRESEAVMDNTRLPRQSVPGVDTDRIVADVLARRKQ